ncbi:MAG: amidohydrolase family protein [Acidobacteria bacterium]|nr:amidohydrolase family protein [Acidobacteriota bacterium]
MPTYHASWIVPIAGPPIRNGWVRTSGGRVVALGDAADRAWSSGAGHEDVELGDVAVMPALVNAHTHLELSWLRGRVPPGHNFIDWVMAQMKLRLSPFQAASQATVRTSIRNALAEMRASGTGVVGDVSNELLELDLLASSGLVGVVFHEILKFNASDPAAFVAKAQSRIEAVPEIPGWRLALAPHAPYSVAPGIFEAIRDTRLPERTIPTSVHVGESPEEMDLLLTGGGRWRDVIRSIGAWNRSWVVPQCGPITFLDRMTFWDAGTLAVHGVQLNDTELDLLAARGATLVTCPRSNVHVGVGAPPVARFFKSGVRIALGTDSLASVLDLNLFAELAELHGLAPDVPSSDLLACATTNGAVALGLGGEHGTIEAGKRAALVAVKIPAGTADVEQCLVSGITPDLVQWIESPSC